MRIVVMTILSFLIHNSLFFFCPLINITTYIAISLIFCKNQNLYKSLIFLIFYCPIFNFLDLCLNFSISVFLIFFYLSLNGSLLQPPMVPSSLISSFPGETFSSLAVSRGISFYILRNILQLLIYWEYILTFYYSKWEFSSPRYTHM